MTTGFKIMAVTGWALMQATSGVAGENITGEATEFSSWFGVTEQCVRVTPMPGASFSEQDVAEEAALCGLDLYDMNIAICPKIWSTSPSVVLYDLAGSKLENERRKFQEDICPGGKAAKYVATAELARLKFTMNNQGTSAAYAPAPILYYNLSRYLDTDVHVAPAVWRSIDTQVLLGEVALDGAFLTEGTRTSKIHAAWQTIVDTVRDPESYVKPGSYGTSADLLMANGALAYGTLLNATGSGFDEEVNGVEEDDTDTSIARMRYFLRTPGLIALQVDAPLGEAIEAGMARAVPPVSESMPDGLSAEQVAFWARELSETALLDFILSQQDRPGNIDKKDYYYWKAGDRAEHVSGADHSPGDGTVPDDALLIRRALLNDNDAAGRVEYFNDAWIAGLLSRLRHFDAGVYRKLQELAADIREQGPVWGWLKTSAGISWEESEMIGRNAIAAAETLAQSCDLGLLRFDLDPEAFLFSGQTQQEPVPCRIE